MSEPVTHLTVPTVDGRELEVLVGGRPEHRPVVIHGGTPGGPAQHAPVSRAATEVGLRVVTYGRPGYGRSTPSPGRTVADAAADTVAILDHLGAEHFVTVGISGGGPHALACAALLPGRCLAAAAVAGIAPWDATGLDLLAGMGPENIEEFGLAVEGAEALTPWLQAQAAGMRGIRGAEVAEALGGLVPDVDRAALTGELADFFAETLRWAVSSGVSGWRDDDLAMVAPWGFDLAGITVPVSIWQGAQDLMVPFAHGQWLGRNVPGADVHLLDEHGHLSLTTLLPSILADLADRVSG